MHIRADSTVNQSHDFYEFMQKPDNRELGVSVMNRCRSCPCSSSGWVFRTCVVGPPKETTRFVFARPASGPHFSGNAAEPHGTHGCPFFPPRRGAAAGADGALCIPREQRGVGALVEVLRDTVLGIFYNNNVLLLLKLFVRGAPGGPLPRAAELRHQRDLPLRFDALVHECATHVSKLAEAFAGQARASHHEPSFT